MIPILTSLILLFGMFSTFTVVALGAWKSFEAAELSQRSVARMAEMTVVVKGSLWVDSSGVPRAPLGDVGPDGRQHLPASLVGDGSTPWGSPYGWCPVAIPPAPGVSTSVGSSVTVAGGATPYPASSVIASRLGGSPLAYVVASPRIPDSATAADAVVGFIVSPPPYATALPDCGDVTLRAGFPVVVPNRGPAGSVVEVSARGSVLSALPSLPAVASDLHVAVAPVAKGDGGGEDPADAMAFGDAVRLWRQAQPRSTVFDLLPGRYVLASADADFRTREPGRAVRLVSGAPGAAVFASASDPTRIEFSGDVVLDGVSTDTGTSVVFERGSRASLRSSSIANLVVAGGEVVTGPDSAIGALSAIGGTLRATGAPYDPGSPGVAPATGAMNVGTVAVGDGDVDVDGLTFAPAATFTWSGRGSVSLQSSASFGGSTQVSVPATATCAAPDGNGLVACRADCDPVHPRVTYPTCDGDGAPLAGASSMRAANGVETHVCMFRPLSFAQRTVLTPGAGSAGPGTTTAVDLDTSAPLPSLSASAACTMSR